MSAEESRDPKTERLEKRDEGVGKSNIPLNGKKMPLQILMKNVRTMVKTMKDSELNIPTKENATPSSETRGRTSETNKDQPKWISNISSSIKLFHEIFAAIRTGMFPILLFCFLFIPSAIGSGIGTITTAINNVLDKMAENGQSGSVSKDGFSVTQTFTPPQKMLINTSLVEKGQDPVSIQNGEFVPTISQLKIAGDDLEKQRTATPGDDKLIDTTRTKIIDALASQSASNLVQGWVYLGKTKDNKTLAGDGITSNKTDINDLKQNATITLTDGVYLRKEANECEGASGEIITAIPVGETVTLLNDANICKAKGTVWVKVRRN